MMMPKDGKRKKNKSISFFDGTGDIVQMPGEISEETAEKIIKDYKSMPHDKGGRMG